MTLHAIAIMTLVAVSLGGCAAPPADLHPGESTRLARETFIVQNCKYYAADGSYAVNGCMHRLANATGERAVTVEPPANLTGITVRSQFAAASLSAVLHFRVTQAEGVSKEYTRDLLAEGRLDAMRGTRTVDTLFAICDVATLTFWTDSSPSLEQRHQLFAHVADDLEAAKDDGSASCNGYLTDR